MADAVIVPVPEDKQFDPVFIVPAHVKDNVGDENINEFDPFVIFITLPVFVKFKDMLLYNETDSHRP